MIDVIKDIASNIVNSQNFSSFYKGVVVSESPLSIELDNGLVIDENFIILNRLVTDFEESGKIELEICCESKKWYDCKIKYERALKLGDNISVVKENGGQRYLVIDRLREEGNDDIQDESDDIEQEENEGNSSKKCCCECCKSDDSENEEDEKNEDEDLEFDLDGGDEYDS